VSHKTISYVTPSKTAEWGTRGGAGQEEQAGEQQSTQRNAATGCGTVDGRYGNWGTRGGAGQTAQEACRVSNRILLLLHGSGRSHEHPVQEPEYTGKNVERETPSLGRNREVGGGCRSQDGGVMQELVDLTRTYYWRHTRNK
jgi:hypothetical protein